MKDPEDPHPFRSAQAREEYLSMYDLRARAWPHPLQEKMVDTSLGQTYVRVNGPEDAPPLFLMPGSVLNSLMWLPNIRALSGSHRTYAVDHIYDCGRSIYSRRPKNLADLVTWMDDLFSRLEPERKINLLGLSYGSWLSHQYALRFPQKVSRMVLLAHPAIVPMNFKFIIRLFSAFFSPHYFYEFVHWLFQDTAQMDEEGKKNVNEILADMQLAGKNYKGRVMINPALAGDDELRNLKTPALFLMGENEKTFSPAKAIERITRVAPHQQAELIPHAGHDLNFAQADLINQKVSSFLQ